MLTSLGIPCWNHGACRNSGSERGMLLLPEPCDTPPPHDDAPDDELVVRLHAADALLENELLKIVINKTSIISVVVLLDLRQYGPW